MVEFRADTSFPFLALSRRLGLPYRHVLLCAEVVDKQMRPIDQPALAITNDEMLASITLPVGAAEPVINAVLAERNRRLQLHLSSRAEKS
jgi:hypothetical protein